MKFLRLLLAFVWVLVVGAWAAYVSLTETGPVGWLIEQQINLFGSYYGMITKILFCLLLIAPAARIAGFKPNSVEQGSAEWHRKQISSSKAMAFLSLLMIATAGGLYVLSQKVSTKQTEPIVLTADQPVSWRLWFEKVRMNGELLSDQTLQIETTGKRGNNIDSSAYTPVKLNGANTSEPIQFVATFNPETTYNHTIVDAAEGDDLIQGYLQIPLIPAYCRLEWKKSNITLSDNVVVIAEDGLSRQELCWAVGAVLALIGLILLFTSPFTALKSKRALRKIEAA